MKKLCLTLAVCLSLVLSSGLALAATTPQPTDKVPFATLDKDENGKLTYAEVMAAYPSVTKSKFGKWDKDKKGYLTEDEYNALSKKDLGQTRKAAKDLRKKGNTMDQNF